MLRALRTLILANLALAVWAVSTTYNLLEDIWHTLTSVGTSIADVFSGIWNTLTKLWQGTEDVFRAVGHAWEWLYNGLTWLGDTTVSVITDIVDGVGWLISSAIPDVLGSLVGWANGAIDWVWDSAQTLVKDTVNAVVRFLVDLITGVRDFLLSLYHDLERILNDVVHWVENFGYWVWDTVSHPDKLLAWIWDTFVLWFIKEFWYFIRAVVSWLWSSMRHDAGAFFHALEDIVSAII